MEETISRLKDSFNTITTETTATSVKQGQYLYLNSSSYRKWNEPTAPQVLSSFQKALAWILKSEIFPVSQSDSARIIPILWDLLRSIDDFDQERDSEGPKPQQLLHYHINKMLPPEGLFSLNPAGVTPDFIVAVPILFELNIISEAPVRLFVTQCLGETHNLLKQYSENSDQNSSQGSTESLQDSNNGLLIVDPVRCAAILSAVHSLDLYDQHTAQCKELQDYVLGCLEAELIEESQVSLSIFVRMVEAAEASGASTEFLDEVLPILVDRLLHRTGLEDAIDCGLRILGLSSLKALDDKNVRNAIATGDLKSLIKLQNSDGSWPKEETKSSEVCEFGQVFVTATCMAAVSRFC